MQLETITKKTVEFLKKFGRFEHPYLEPDFGETKAIHRYDPQGMRMRFENDFEVMYAMMGEPVIYKNTVEREFDHVNGSLEHTSDEEFRKKIINIPDSSEFVLVDIGSNLGRYFTRPFARKHPNVKIYMVDTFDIETLKNPHVFKSVPESEAFEVKVDYSDSVEDTMNRLLDANGFKNITYIDKGLVQTFTTNLPQIKSDLEGKRVIFYGWKNPASLGFLTHDEARYHNAEAVCTTLTGLETSHCGEYNIYHTKKNVGNLFTQNEFSKYIHLLLDHDAKKKGSKYDYEDAGQKAFSGGLKLLVNLGACNQLQEAGYNVKLLRKIGNHFRNHNQADHIIYAHKKENMLKL